MSRHHDAAKWSKLTKAARVRITATLPAPCIECGRPIVPGQPFDVGHRVPLSLGGSVSDYGPAHIKCNRRAGGKLGGRISSKRDPRDRSTDGTRAPSW